MSSLPTPQDIRRLRLKAGLTQKELARRAGVSQSLIARIERGTVNPRLSTLRKIVRVLEEALQTKIKAEDIMHSPVIVVKADDPVSKAAELMIKYGISQIPVIEDNRIIGTIYEDDIVNALMKKPEKDVASWPVKKIMSDILPIVSPEESVDTITRLLLREPAVLVVKKGELIGIITKSDIIKYKILTGKITGRRER